MGDAGTRYNLANQPEGVERIWKALERLGRKATGGVPSFANNTELKFWLAAVGGRHEVHGDRPKADAYARCLENLGIAVMSESHGLLIDLERVAQLRNHLNSAATWDKRDDETLAARARWFEQSIVLAEQSDADAEDIDATVADTKDVDETVTDAVAVKPAPESKSPAERLAAAMARLEELRAKSTAIDQILDRLGRTEQQLERLDRELDARKKDIEAIDRDIDSAEANLPLATSHVAHAQEMIDALEVQLAQARAELTTEVSARAKLDDDADATRRLRQTRNEEYQEQARHYAGLLETYEELERQRDGATLTSAERVEMGRIERALEALNDLTV